MAVLQADNFLGPYKIVNKGFRPNGFESGDFDLYVDENTGKATYVWLPIRWENGIPNIYWKEEWKLEDYK